MLNDGHIYRLCISYSIFSFIILMNQQLQEEILQNNTKLLRKSLQMEQTTPFESLVRILNNFVTNGITLFNSWCQPLEAKPQGGSNDLQPHPQQSPRQHLKYNFQLFEENQQNGINNDVENRDKSFNKSSKQLESFSDDRQNSKIAEEEQSFENKFKKGNKRMKIDASESSFQKQNKKNIKTVDKQASHFYESINFSVFLEMQKNLLEARKKCNDKKQMDANLKCEDYIKYAMKVGSLTTSTEAKTDKCLQNGRSETTTIRKDQKVLRKKVQFEDDSHQLYDLSKVFETLDAEKYKREQIRQLQAQRLRREEEERLRMIERMELQKKIEAQRHQEQEAARLQRQLQEKERKLAEERLQEDQRQKEKEIQNVEQLQAASKQSEAQQAGEKQLSSVEDASKSPVLEKQELPQSNIASPTKKASQQKKEQVLLGTPVKGEKAEQKPHTPFKVQKANNPFFNPPTKALNLQDLINTHKPSTENSFFSTNNVTSPPRSNIFNNQVPVNNLFTGGQPPQQMTPVLSTTSTPLPTMMQPQMPQLSSYTNPIMNNQNNSFGQSPQGSFFQPMGNSPGFGSNNHMQNTNLSINPVNSSNMPTFPVMPITTPFSKNLFMNQPPQQTSLFGSTNTNNNTSAASRANTGRKKAQIRVS